ncbi:MAG: EamA family transporter [Clostridiales bacterium]|nr:EamA family transporter [Candidatus Cacconaster stercorequi]
MKKYISYIYVVLGAACWGFIGVFNRILATTGITMGNRVLIRNFGSLLLMTVVFAFIHPQVFHIQKKHLPLFLGSGLLSVVGLGWTYFSCQLMCSLAVAGILLYLAPSFVVIGSAILWKAPLTRRKIAALALALCGCALVSGIVGGDVKASVPGILLGIGAGLCYASYTIFSHYGLAHYDSLTMIYWTFLVAGLASLVFLDAPAMADTLRQPNGIIGAVGLVVIATVLPYIFYTKGLEGVESGVASVIANVEPVVAALTGVIFFNETLNIWTVLGIILVLTAAVLLAKGDNP